MAQILVLGGTGVFGSRIVRRLAATHTVAAGSRHAAPRLPVGVPHVFVDANDLSSVRSALQRVRPRVVINAAGPFQYCPVAASEKFADPALHDAPHVLPRECVAAGASYIDIADNAAWIQRVNELKPPAGGGAVVVSGASTMPALTGAVVAHLARGLREVHAIDIGMSPGNRAPRGTATMLSILSYVGRRSVAWFTHGAHRLVYGWSQMARRRITVPGGGASGSPLTRSLRPRWFASVDLPDPLLLPRAYGVRDRVTARAGLELPVMHWGLAALGLGVRAGVLGDLTRGVRWLHRAASALEGFGSDEGGLFVDVAGVRADTGRPVVRRWALIAGSGDGPNVPALPAAALARQLCSGAGTSAASGVASAASPFFPLPLEAILAEARGLDIVTGSEEVPPVYEAAVGSAAYAQLPAAIRALHDTVGESRWRGTAQVAPAATGVGRLIGRLFAMPPPGRDVPLQFTLSCEGGVERWERHFGTSSSSSGGGEVGFAPRRPFVSHQYVSPGTGAFPLASPAPTPPGTIIERFGPLEFGLRVDTHAKGLDLHLVSMTALGFLPIPRPLWPAITASERVVDGRFHFDVGISLPGVGRLVRYNGWLERDAMA